MKVKLGFHCSPMETRSFVVKWLATLANPLLAGAQRAEILDRLRTDARKKLYLHAATLSFSQTQQQPQLALHLTILCKLKYAVL